MPHNLTLLPSASSRFGQIEASELVFLADWLNSVSKLLFPFYITTSLLHKIIEIVYAAPIKLLLIKD